MKSKHTLLDELMTIPEDCEKATIQGVPMQLITDDDKSQLMAQEQYDTGYHECIMKNGTFIFTTNDQHKLQSLFKRKCKRLFRIKK